MSSTSVRPADSMSRGPPATVTLIMRAPYLVWQCCKQHRRTHIDGAAAAVEVRPKRQRQRPMGRGCVGAASLDAVPEGLCAI